LRRSKSIGEEFSLPELQQLPVERITARNAREQRRSEELHCGPFSGTFLYTPPAPAKRAREIDAVGAGVLLYRDGLLVEPYGFPGNDWVGVAARKASRQGHAAIQPATFSGYVSISRRKNPELEDMSSRLGLIENEAAEDFFSHVRAEFAYFEGLLYEEVLRPRWRTKEAKATAQAKEAGTLATVRLRATAHSVGQPLQALGFEILRLETVAQRPDIPVEVREELLDIQRRMEAHVSRLGKTIARFADVTPPEFGAVDVNSLIQDAVDEVTEFADVEEGDIIRVMGPESTVLTPRVLVFEALAELLRNAIEVPRPESRSPEIEVSFTEFNATAVDIRIIDNGTGFVDAGPDTPLTAIPSTKARPAEGLATTENAIIVSRGRVRIEKTGAEGTVMQVRLPQGLATVPLL
jgi:signal transduction histidine kinase